MRQEVVFNPFHRNFSDEAITQPVVNSPLNESRYDLSQDEYPLSHLDVSTYYERSLDSSPHSYAHMPVSFAMSIDQEDLE
jgi:hypothetical protein